MKKNIIKYAIVSVLSIMSLEKTMSTNTMADGVAIEPSEPSVEKTESVLEKAFANPGAGVAHAIVDSFKKIGYSSVDAFKAVKQELKSGKDEINLLKEKLNKNQMEMTEKDGEISELKTKISTLEQENGQHLVVIKQKQRSLDQSKGTSGNQKGELGKLRDDQAQKEIELSQHKTQLQILEKEHAASKNELQRKSEELEELRGAKSELESKLSKVQIESDLLKENNTKIEKQCDELSKRLDDLTRNHEELTKDHKELTKNHKASSSGKEALVQGTKKVIISLGEDVVSLETEVKKLNNNNPLKRRLIEIQNALRLSKSELEVSLREAGESVDLLTTSGISEGNSEKKRDDKTESVDMATVTAPKKVGEGNIGVLGSPENNGKGGLGKGEESVVS